MSTPDRTLNRRDFLRVAGGLAGVGIVASRGRSSAKNVTYHSIPDFHPPSVSVKVNKGHLSPGLVITECHLGTSQQGPLILSGEGELIWFDPRPSHGAGALRAFNVRVQRYNGEPVLTWFEGTAPSGHGVGDYIIADTSYRTIATVKAQRGLQGDLHEFFLTPQGSAVFTAYGSARGNLTSAGGSSDGLYFFCEFQEVDVATGKLLFWWRSDAPDNIAFDESYVPPGHPDTAWDYMHINSIALDPLDGNFIVSGRNTWTVYKINRSTGAIMWRLGGKRSDFSKNYPSEAHFAYQHDATPWSGGIMTIFDNEGSPWVKPPSRGLEIAVNESARTVEFRREFHHSPAVDSPDLGSVQLLSDGHYFIGWGTSAYFTEYSQSGELLFDARVDGVESYRAFKQPWSATPATPPAIAVVTTGTTKSVYVSWNGATEVARWRLLGGGATGALKTLATVPKSGFETRIAIPTGQKRVAVEALNAAGSVIGRSATHDV